jgi:hypothetical protein
MTVPAPESLGNGIHMIPAPLPFKSPAWVNAYVVEADDGLLLIDCGTDWEPGRRALGEGFHALGLDESAVHGPYRYEWICHGYPLTESRCPQPLRRSLGPS